MQLRFAILIFAIFSITTSSPKEIIAGEVRTNVRTIENIQDIKEGDNFGISDIQFEPPRFLSAEVTASGGCEDHNYTLFLSERILESFPPVIQGKMVLDKNGDTCRALVDGKVIFDLGALQVDGDHFLQLEAGPVSEQIMVRIDKASLTGASSGLEIKDGNPPNWGDPIIAIDHLEVVSGIDRYWLKADVVYGGGCVDHEFEVWWDGLWEKSNPPGAGLILIHDNKGDTCKALVSDTLYIDMSRLVDSESVFRVTLSIFGGSSMSVDFP